MQGHFLPRRLVYLLLTATSCGYSFAQASGSQESLLLHENHLEVRGEQSQVDSTAEAICATDLWFVSRHGKCTCGNTIHEIVECDNQTKSVKILDCYCMTPDSTHQMVVGDCFYNCLNLTRHFSYKDYIYHQAPSTCDYLHRTGTLCGQCDYSNSSFPRAYSYDMECIQCTKQQSWWLYIAVAFLPLTVFIVIILVFRISVVSPELRAFVCFAQVVAAPIQIRILLLSNRYTSPLIAVLTNVVLTLYGIWNLDFFRTLQPGVCLHLNTLEVLALDYLIAVYPMLLMVMAYTLVELHGRGCRPLLLLWKPFHRCFVRFRREWNIQTSLIDAFVTFFILSSTKLFAVSFDLLMPTRLYNTYGDLVGFYLYYDANIEYMKHEHLYYALLALAVLALFIFLPLSLMVFSTCKCATRIRTTVVQEFLQAFQKYYKDGTNGTKDCRWYAGYYILSLLGMYLLYTFTLGGFTYMLAILYCTILAIVVLIVEPYKEEYAIYNVLDTVLFLWQAFFAASVSVLNFAGMLQRAYLIAGYVSTVIGSIVPLIFIGAVVIRWILGRIRCLKARKVSDFDASLAHRITNSGEYRDNCGYVRLQGSIDVHVQ